jgi:hypothetical protein
MYATAQQTSEGMLVSLLGVITGIAPPTQVLYSSMLRCPSCSQNVVVIATQPFFRCCGLPCSSALGEDLSGR